MKDKSKLITIVLGILLVRYFDTCKSIKCSKVA